MPRNAQAGDKYPDSQCSFLAGVGNYILLTFRKGKPSVVELKALDGRVLDRTAWPRRSR